jgi:tetraacyldisaccharide-1-P 4'-kinase
MHTLDPKEPFHPKDLSGRILAQRPVFAFSALARNETFQAALCEIEACVLGARGFADHHRYSRSDIEDLVQTARRSGCSTLVTTDKDFVRLPPVTLPMELIVIGVDIEFGDDCDQWWRYILDKVTNAPGFVDRKNKQVC